MNIIKNKNGKKLDVSVEGRLDSNTSPELDSIVANELVDVSEFTLDFSKLVYISSAGLRVILAAYKKMNKAGSIVIKNINNDVKEVFELTGFGDMIGLD